MADTDEWNFKAGMDNAVRMHEALEVLVNAVLKVYEDRSLSEASKAELGKAFGRMRKIMAGALKPVFTAEELAESAKLPHH